MRARFSGRSLAEGWASGPSLRLDAPLSLWGGVDLATGAIVDVSHPQVGQEVAARVLLMPSARGSSSSSSALVELARQRIAPAAILLGCLDPILAIGALVAEELYDIQIPIVVIDRQTFEHAGEGVQISVTANAGMGLIEIDRRA